MARLTYEQRLDQTSNPLLKKLFGIIIAKKSNLCVAADFDSVEEVLNFAEAFGTHIAILKTHLEEFITTSNTVETLDRLYALKKKHNFLLFEDRKFGDSSDVNSRIYRKNWVRHVDLVTMKPYSDESFEAIQTAVTEANLPEDEPRGCLAFCEASFAKLATFEATSEALAIANRHKICAGIIAQTLQVPDVCSMVKVTPGVHLSSKRPEVGDQRWNPPSKVIGSGADIVVVGRGITSGPADEMEKRVLNYKEACWGAYCDEIKKRI